MYSLGVWEREEDPRSLPIHNPLVLSQRSIKTTVRKISRYVPPQVAQSIPDICSGGWHANDTAIVLSEQVDGMDEDLCVWMCPRINDQHRQCLPDFQTQGNTVAMSQPERDV